MHGWSSSSRTIRSGGGGGGSPPGDPQRHPGALTHRGTARRSAFGTLPCSRLRLPLTRTKVVSSRRRSLPGPAGLTVPGRPATAAFPLAHLAGPGAHVSSSLVQLYRDQVALAMPPTTRRGAASATRRGAGVNDPGRCASGSRRRQRAARRRGVPRAWGRQHSQRRHRQRACARHLTARWRRVLHDAGSRSRPLGSRLTPRLPAPPSARLASDRSVSIRRQVLRSFMAKSRAWSTTPRRTAVVVVAGHRHAVAPAGRCEQIAFSTPASTRAARKSPVSRSDRPGRPTHPADSDPRPNVAAVRARAATEVEAR